jgi:hypothetical protein
VTVQEAIAAANALLPGHAAPEGEIDPRWQAVIAVGEFIEDEPEAVWSFIVRWDSSPDEDLRAAIATCLLEHLLQHFDRFIPRVEQIARADPLFGDMAASCWKFGQSEEPERSARFDRLVRSIHRSAARVRSSATKPANGSKRSRRCGRWPS